MIYITCSQEKYFRTIGEQRIMSLCLLRTSLLTEYGIDLTTCQIVKNCWGKPLFQNHQGVHFNISHCQGGVALSLSACRTGIDMERVRPYSPAAARRTLTDDELLAITKSECPERLFFRFWVLKESYTKALGTGLSYPLNKINFSIDRDLNVSCSKKDCQFLLFENDLQYITAVCYLGRNDHSSEAAVYRLLP